MRSMHSLNRWWQKNQWIVILGGLSLLVVGGLKAIGVLPVREIYQGLSQPFQPKASQKQAELAAQTASLNARIRELEQQNQALSEMLDQPKIKQKKAIAVAVVGRSADQWWQHVYLNQGTLSGIASNSIVEAPGGLAGRVIEASPGSSQVLLISDPDSRLAVVLSRSRSVGILQGDRKNQGILEFFDQDPSVKPGDAVVTSPLSCLFPPGIPVGTVKSIVRSKQQTLQAIIDFNVSLGKLEWVSVYKHEKAKKKSAAASACP